MARLTVCLEYLNKGEKIRMKILMIGNGFDLEHELPTKYTHFLEFVKKFKYAYLSRKNIPTAKDDYIRLIFENPEYGDRVIALHAFTADNVWINYFQKVYNKHLANKQNWIDFESEISSVIQSMDGLIKYYERIEAGENKNESLEMYYKNRLSKIMNPSELKAENVKAYIPKLLCDLNKLIGALEIYIWDYIGSKKLEYYNPDIEKIHPDKVFSFNYSDTYKKLYAYNKKEIDYSFVHGIAINNITFFSGKTDATEEEIEKCIQRNAETNNMVLGIDEYLPEARRSNEIEFIDFKKYYQRILKKAGNEYKKWLKQIDNDVKEGKKEENILYIFGHSLDVTDGDVLREFINHDNLKTIIFYRDKAQLGQQIANLVKILKSDTVIEKVYGDNPIIIFQQQSKRERISGSAFEITSDTMQLENVYRLSHLEAESLFEKIKYKIEQEDLTYFYSQKAVITLFDVMQKNGLATMYITKLLEIARKLMRCDGLQEPEQFDEEYWAYLDYDNSFSCDILTRKFVNTINLYNKKNFVISEMEMQSYDEQLLEYEKLIKSREKIDKDRYMIIINSIFYMFIDEYKDIEKLWKILLRISRGPGEDVAKDVLKELIENSDDELEIIRYNHLLQEIQMNEYFDMQAEEFEKSYEYE